MGPKVRFGFVVLHYMAYAMTVECVLSLLRRFGNEAIRIAIVDNASGNASGRKLAEFFRGQHSVDVLLNPTNEGFARGNNVGYRHLIEKYHPEYIIILNNDVLIEQDDFLAQIDAIHKETAFAVLGPDIYCPATGKHQNPAHLKGLTRDELEQMHDDLRRRCRHPVFYYMKVTLGKLKRKVLTPDTDAIDRSVMMENVVLHGACYVFSSRFIERRENCFCPDTFLYMEEDILHEECMRSGLKMVYSPKISVAHWEDVSTHASIRSGYERFKMKNSEMKRSMEVLIKRMRKEG